jgi:hypothetical protein
MFTSGTPAGYKRVTSNYGCRDCVFLHDDCCSPYHITNGLSCDGSVKNKIVFKKDVEFDSPSRVKMPAHNPNLEI